MERRKGVAMANSDSNAVSRLSEALTEMREAILAEFLKPDLPAPVILLCHCEKYAKVAFDVQAETWLLEGIPDYSSKLEQLIRWVPKMIFGLGMPWDRCIVYAMLGRRCGEPDPTSEGA